MGAICQYEGKDKICIDFHVARIDDLLWTPRKKNFRQSTKGGVFTEMHSRDSLPTRERSKIGRVRG